MTLQHYHIYRHFRLYFKQYLPIKLNIYQKQPFNDGIAYVIIPH